MKLRRGFRQSGVCALGTFVLGLAPATWGCGYVGYSDLACVVPLPDASVPDARGVDGARDVQLDATADRHEGGSVGDARHDSREAGPAVGDASSDASPRDARDAAVSDGVADAGHDAFDAPAADQGCIIGGVVYAAGVTTNGGCAVCAPAASSAAWSNLADGTKCGTGEVCSAGICASGCFIGGTGYASMAVNPSNACQTCVPATSTTAWSNLADGTSCGVGEVCSTGTCESGCFIGGTVYAPMAVNPSSVCQTCVPATSTTAWSSVTGEIVCGGSCIDPNTSDSNCGASGDCAGGNAGTQCMASETCAAGSCQPLIGYWPLDDAPESMTAADLSGNNLTGTVTDVTFVPGAGHNGGGAGQFTDINNSGIVIKFPDTAVSPGNGPYMPVTNITYSMWFKTPAGATTGSLQALTQSTDNDDRNAILDGNVLQYYVYFHIVWNGTITVNDGNWHHFAWSFESGVGFYTYIDGVLDYAQTGSTESGPGRSDFNWADTYHIGGGLVGYIDDVRIYNVALSATQVAQLYAAEK